MGRRSRAITALKGVATVLVTIFIMALILEGILRVRSRPTEAPPEPARETPRVKLTIPDPELGWAFRPSDEGSFRSGAHPTDVSTNEIGLRSPSLSSQQDAAIKILVLGDSYGFGWGVEEREAFPRQMERILLERRPELSAAVINACAPGYGLFQQRAMLERVLEATHVDVVVTTFSLANDPLDDLRILRFAPDRLLDYSPELGERNRFMKWLVRHSALVGLIDHRTGGVRFKLVNASPEAVAASERCMRELFDVCEDHDLEVVQVQIPQRWEVKQRFGTDFLRASSKASREMRERVSSEYGVVSVDAAPPLLKLEEETGAAYLSNDAHWTPAGHEAVAEAVLEALPEDWLAPGRRE